MNNFLAKSNPKDTIQEHTDALIKNYYILKSIYSDKFDIKWDMLYIACLYHDLGKMNLKFQDKLEKGNYYRSDIEIAHNFLSLAFLDAKEIMKKYNLCKEDVKVIAHAIAYHHDRGDYNASNYEEEIELLKKEIINFEYDKVNITNIQKLGVRYFNNVQIRSKDILFKKYVLIKGLLNRLDYAASGYIEVESKNDFLLKALNSYKDNNFKQWNEVQEFMIKNKDENVIVVAQTGMGKTEAGLLWIGNNKGFFTLPLKTAINSIYKRITDKIVLNNNEEKVGLLHGETFMQYAERESNRKDSKKDEELDIEEYCNKTKQLALPLTICTLDQLFDFVFIYRGFEPKLATLSYSKIVIDEIQMYSADLLAYLIIGLYYIDKFGGKFAILTATLPPLILDLMTKEGIKYILPKKPFIDDKIIRHSIKNYKQQIDSNIIASYFDNNKVLVICNTVNKAQQIYDELIKNIELKKKNTSINLLHSRFTQEHRKAKELHIKDMGETDSKEVGIWITTQVVEASLDIDFDLLFTELSDLNGLFQRMGRCFRKRKFNGNGYNCYVFTGGKEPCSGIGNSDKSIIDLRIFEFSKEALSDVDGFITENKKVELINEIYSTEKLKDTEYYIKLRKFIKNTKDKNEYGESVREAKEAFRKIKSIMVIPLSAYKKNMPIIEENKKVINLQYEKSMPDKNIKALRKKKTLARSNIMLYTLSIQEYQYEDAIKKDAIKYEATIKLGKFNEIPIVNFEYSYERGLDTNIIIQNDNII